MAKTYKSQHSIWYRQNGLWRVRHAKTGKEVWFLLGGLEHGATSRKISRAVAELENLADWSKINTRQAFFSQVKNLLARERKK